MMTLVFIQKRIDSEQVKLDKSENFPTARDVRIWTGQGWHPASAVDRGCPCLVLTVASLPAYRFLRKQVRWPGIPIT